MQLTSFVFFIFLILSAIAYYAFPKKSRWIILLFAGGVFYLYGGLKTVWCLIMTTLTTYASALLIDLVRQKSFEKNKTRRINKSIVASAVAINFVTLYFLKYWNFTAEILSSGKLKLPVFDIIMPLGVSFFMFQSVGYVIDVYRGKTKAERNPFKYSLFTSFFPQMVQGPISRYNELAPQLTEGNDFSYENLKNGILLILRGVFKKLIIADRAAIFVNAVLDSYTSYSGSVILLGVLLYSVQLYCDFSGGIDVARGAASLFGINMAENFKRPLFATSLADFWRRWHITLGAWMKDYLFYPISLSAPFIKLGKFSRRKIGGKIGKILPTSLATFIIYFVIGIWHGSSFKYIAFGFWNGFIITASLLLEPFYISLKKKMKINSDSGTFYVFSVVRTWIIIVAGRYITRAGRFTAALAMMKKTFAEFGISSLTPGFFTSFGLTITDYSVIIAGCLYIFISELMEEKGRSLSDRLSSGPVYLQFAAMLITLVIIVIFGIYRGDYISSEFIYKQF